MSYDYDLYIYQVILISYQLIIISRLLDLVNRQIKVNITYFSPVWILTCLSSCDCFMNAFGHDGQRFIADGDFNPDVVVAVVAAAVEGSTGLAYNPPERKKAAAKTV